MNDPNSTPSSGAKSKTAESDQAPRSADEADEAEPLEPAPGASAEADSPKLKKRRKRSKRTKQEPDLVQGPLLDEQGRERPWFLSSFPDDPELLKLTRAFEAGNYAFVREQAPHLARSTQDEAVKGAALELIERIKPDPLMKYMLFGSMLLLLYLMLHAYTTHGH